jgi:hypothetical protein
VELVWLTLIGKQTYPPITYRAAIYYAFPFSLFWFSFPIAALLPIPREDKVTLLVIGMLGSLCVMLALCDLAASLAQANLATALGGSLLLGRDQRGLHTGLAEDEPQGVGAPDRNGGRTEPVGADGA